MAVDPVPAVIHGAKHSADVFRQWIDNSTGGAEGVSSPTSLNVRATGTPSGQVRVAPGGVLIPNSYSGGAGQSYTGRNASETLVDVPESDSTGAKSWHIIFRVQDPQFGGPTPPTPEDGPYSFIECVAASATITDPHYVLAKLVVPKSTSAIQGEHITDVRSLAQPQREPFTFGRPRVASDGAQNLGRSVDNGGEFFPGNNDSGPSSSLNSFEVDVPTWANRILLNPMWTGVRYAANSNPRGRYWIEYGDEFRSWTWPNKRQYEFATQQFGFNAPNAGDVSNDVWSFYSSQHLPEKLRGKRITIAFKAGRTDSGSASEVSMGGLGGLGMQGWFVQTALDPKNQDEAS